MTKAKLLTGIFATALLLAPSISHAADPVVQTMTTKFAAVNKSDAKKIKIIGTVNKADLKEIASASDRGDRGSYCKEHTKLGILCFPDAALLDTTGKPYYYTYCVSPYKNGPGRVGNTTNGELTLGIDFSACYQAK